MDDETVARSASQLAESSPQEVLRWALQEFQPKIALASSFGAEDMVLIDMLAKITPNPRIFALDTGRLHEETYELMDQTRKRYGLTIDVYYPETSTVEKMVREKGFFSFRESIDNRHECCGIRKVEPLGRALANLDAWITGLRREQSVTRTDIRKVESDAGHGGIVKVNPLVEWSESQVWEYIRENQVPSSPLHDRGYPSIGCAPCTRAIQPGEHPRAGRWWWESPEQKECGLHVAKAGS